MAATLAQIPATLAQIPATLAQIEIHDFRLLATAANSVALLEIAWIRAPGGRRLPKASEQHPCMRFVLLCEACMTMSICVHVRIKFCVLSGQVGVHDVPRKPEPSCGYRVQLEPKHVPCESRRSRAGCKA